MGINLNTVNYWYVFYVLFSVVLVAGGTFALYSSANLGRTVIYAIGVSLIMLFFGMRWFGNIPSTSKLWPPTINMCPDYLTFVRGTNVSGCVDTLGVGGLEKISPSEMSAPPQSKVFGVTGTNNIFIAYTSASVMGSPAVAGVVGVPAVTNAAGVITTPAIQAVSARAAVAATAENVQAICDACKLNGLTWEGVWDGDTCLALNRFTEALAMKKASGCPA